MEKYVQVNEPERMVGGGMSGSIIFIRANMFMSDSIMNSYSGGLGSSGGSVRSSDSSFHMPGLNRDLKKEPVSM